MAVGGGCKRSRGWTAKEMEGGGGGNLVDRLWDAIYRQLWERYDRLTSEDSGERFITSQC